MKEQRQLFVKGIRMGDTHPTLININQVMAVEKRDKLEYGKSVGIVYVAITDQYVEFTLTEPTYLELLNYTIGGKVC